MGAKVEIEVTDPNALRELMSLLARLVADGKVRWVRVARVGVEPKRELEVYEV